MLFVACASSKFLPCAIERPDPLMRYPLELAEAVLAAEAVLIVTLPSCDCAPPANTAVNPSAHFYQSRFEK
jgi:hypothetical protein